MVAAQEVMLAQTHAVEVWTVVLKVPLAVPQPLAEAAAEAAVALGALAGGREAGATHLRNSGCLPVLLNMLRSTQVCCSLFLSPRCFSATLQVLKRVPP